MARTLSQQAFRRVALFARGALIGIVLTGSWVRLTGSGLGCSDWPECNSERFVDVSSWHAAIEQVNRLLTGVVAASVVLAVLASLAVRPAPRHARWLASSLVVGVLLQVVIGAYVVWTGLNPWSNMTHFLVSAVLVVLSTLLVRVAHPDNAQLGHLEGSRSLGALFAVATTCAIVTGTMVTGSGPHAGDENAIRLGFEIRDIARVHSASVWVSLGVLVLIIRKVRKSPSSVLHREVSLVLGAFMAQGFVGYVQYFSGIPAALVALHIAGSVAVTVTTTNLVASLLDRTASASA
ncbi:MAG: heme A synthase [Actinobacteria bacterium]|nr:heme A synthase [Actinomycetota bacterium]